jgi:pimeloyl-ACP methyl ester carboxylesterase
VLSGNSLGTGVASEMARRGRGSRLVLVAPYTSIPDLVTERVPWVPARFLLADGFDTLAKAPDIHVPTLVIHGDEDEVVPFAMGRRLARSIAGARFIPVAGGRHGDLFARDGRRLLDAIVTLGT